MGPKHARVLNESTAKVTMSGVIQRMFAVIVAAAFIITLGLMPQSNLAFGLRPTSNQPVLLAHSDESQPPVPLKYVPPDRFILTEVADGTHAGPGTECFLNAKNGYTPGDNTTTDGVVCSGDTVTYSYSITIVPGPARKVTVSFAGQPQPKLFERIDFEKSCTASGIISASWNENTSTCTYDVPRGITLTKKGTFVVVAGDTDGQTITGASLNASVNNTPNIENKSDKPVWLTQTRPITVISKPFADLTIDAVTGPKHPERRNQVYSQRSNGNGHITIEPYTLHFDGYSSAGVTDPGIWTTDVDVTDMVRVSTTGACAAGTAPNVTFKFQGKPVVPVKEGDRWIVKNLTNKAPKGSEAVEEGLEGSFDYHLPQCAYPKKASDKPVVVGVKLLPHKDSFSKHGVPNLIEDPGVGEPADFDTSTITLNGHSIGALRGYVVNNNNYGQGTFIYSDTPIPDDIPHGWPPPKMHTFLNYKVWGPRDFSKTLFDKPATGSGSNIHWITGDWSREGEELEPLPHSYNHVTSNNEMRSEVIIDTGSNLFDRASSSSQLIAGVTWDDLTGTDYRHAHFDTKYPVKVRFNRPDPKTKQDNYVDLTPDQYTVQWRTVPKGTKGNPGNQGLDGSADLYSNLPGAGRWITSSYPPDESVNQMRILFADGAFPMHDDDGNILKIEVPVKAASGFTKNDQDKILTSVASARVVDAPINPLANTEPATGGPWRTFRIPTPIAVENPSRVTTSVQNTGLTPIIRGGITTGVYQTSWRVQHRLSGVPRSKQYHPMTTLTLTPGFDASSFTLSPGSLWRVDKTTGNADGTTTVTLSLDVPATLANNQDGLGDFEMGPPINFTVKTNINPTDLTQTVRDHVVEKSILPPGNEADSSASITVTRQVDKSAVIVADNPNHSAETGDLLTWTSYISAGSLSNGDTWSSAVYLPDGLRGSDSSDVERINQVAKNGGWVAKCNPTTHRDDNHIYDRYCSSSYSDPYTIHSITIKGYKPGMTVYYTVKNPNGKLYGVDGTNETPTMWQPATVASDGTISWPAGVTPVGFKVGGTSSEEGQLASVQLNIALQPGKYTVGDDYVVWQKPITVNGVASKIPWPDDNEVVSSTVSGTVWNDINSDGQIDTGENGFKRVDVELQHWVDANNDHIVEDNEWVPAVGSDGQVLPHQLTGDQGNYKFTGLKSGQYRVVLTHVTKGKDGLTHADGDGCTPSGTGSNAIQCSTLHSVTHSRFGGDLRTTQTYSYDKKFGKDSTTIANVMLGVGEYKQNVNFGFVEHNPEAILDKTPATVDTSDADHASLSWDVTVNNNGTEPLTKLSVTDRMGSSAYDVKVGLSYKQKLKLNLPIRSYQYISNGSGNHPISPLQVSPSGKLQYVDLSNGALHNLALPPEMANDTFDPSLTFDRLGNDMLITSNQGHVLKVYTDNVTDPAQAYMMTGVVENDPTLSIAPDWTGVHTVVRNQDNANSFDAILADRRGYLYRYVEYSGGIRFFTELIENPSTHKPIKFVPGQNVAMIQGLFGTAYLSDASGTLWSITISQNSTGYNPTDVHQVAVGHTFTPGLVFHNTGKAENDSLFWNYISDNQGGLWKIVTTSSDGKENAVEQVNVPNGVKFVPGVRLTLNQVQQPEAHVKQYGGTIVDTKGNAWLLLDKTLIKPTSTVRPPVFDPHQASANNLLTDNKGNVWVVFRNYKENTVTIGNYTPANVHFAPNLSFPIAYNGSTPYLPVVLGDQQGRAWVAGIYNSYFAPNTPKDIIYGPQVVPITDRDPNYSHWINTLSYPSDLDKIPANPIMITPLSHYWEQMKSDDYSGTSDAIAFNFADSKGQLWFVDPFSNLTFPGQGVKVFSTARKYDGLPSDFSEGVYPIIRTTPTDRLIIVGKSSRIYRFESLDLQSPEPPFTELVTYTAHDVYDASKPPSSLEPSAVSAADGWTDRTYTVGLPDALYPGESIRLHVTAKVPYDTSSGSGQVFGNQAWFTSVQTPRSGLTHSTGSGMAPGVPAEPVLPSADTANPRGIPGNPTCTSDIDANVSPDDLCDQVPAVIRKEQPHLLNGHIDGVAWFDNGIANGRPTASDALRESGEAGVDGVHVVVYNKDHEQVGDAYADANGHWSVGSLDTAKTYYVKYDLSTVKNAKYPDRSWSIVKWHVDGSPEPNDSDVDATGWVSNGHGEQVAIPAVSDGQTSGGVADMGLKTVDAAIQIIKGSHKLNPQDGTDADDDTVYGSQELAQNSPQPIQNVTPQDCSSAPAPFGRVEDGDGDARTQAYRVCITNTGSLPVTDVSISDSTLKGNPALIGSKVIVERRHEPASSFVSLLPKTVTPQALKRAASVSRATETPMAARTAAAAKSRSAKPAPALTMPSDNAVSSAKSKTRAATLSSLRTMLTGRFMAIPTFAADAKTYVVGKDGHIVAADANGQPTKEPLTLAPGDKVSAVVDVVFTAGKDTHEDQITVNGVATDQDTGALTPVSDVDKLKTRYVLRQTNLDLTKVDSLDARRLLQGATFNVYSCTASTLDRNAAADKADPLKDSCLRRIQTVTTNAQGTTLIRNINAGVYRLSEVVPPSGYLLPNGSWYMQLSVVNGRKQVVVLTSSKMPAITAPAHDEDQNSTTWGRLTISNKRQVFTNVPVTGITGRSVILFGLLLLGISLAAAGYAYLQDRRRFTQSEPYDPTDPTNFYPEHASPSSGVENSATASTTVGAFASNDQAPPQEPINLG